MTDLEQQLMKITDVFASGQTEEAFAQMSALEHACTTDKERSQVMARYVTFFHLMDMLNEELSALAQALVLDPTNPRANYLNAVHYMADERWDDAIFSLNTAARYYPPDDRAHLAEVFGNLSYCWEQTGDLQRAAMYQEIAADLDPEGILVDEPLPKGAWIDDDEDDDDGGVIMLDPHTGLPVEEEPEDPRSASAEIDAMLEEMGVRPGQDLNPAQLKALKKKVEGKKAGPAKKGAAQPVAAGSVPGGKDAKKGGSASAKPAGKGAPPKAGQGKPVRPSSNAGASRGGMLSDKGPGGKGPGGKGPGGKGPGGKGPGGKGPGGSGPVGRGGKPGPGRG